MSCSERSVSKACDTYLEPWLHEERCSSTLGRLLPLKRCCFSSLGLDHSSSCVALTLISTKMMLLRLIGNVGLQFSSFPVARRRLKACCADRSFNVTPFV